MVFDAVYQKKRDTNVSPVIIKIYVPTLALSKSGIWVEVLNFLSACQTSSPVSFTKFSIVRLGKNVNINIKIYPVIFWSLIFWSQMQVSRTNCILQECFREAVICFCNAEYGKMHKKTEHTLKK